MIKNYAWIGSVFLIASLLIGACQRNAMPNSSQPGLQIVASTTIIGDVTRQIVGDEVELTILIPPGADPHTFEPRPQDIAALTQADLVFINGLGLEEGIEPLLEANLKGTLVVVSDGITALPFSEGPEENDHSSNAESTHTHEHTAGDPHTWMDPNNVILWVQNIVSALAQADPDRAAFYQQNAEEYITELRELDRWIRSQVAQIPPDQRKLVTDHAVFGYFADEYGFAQVGLIIPAFSTNAAVSAQELADLEQNIRAQGVKAIFVGKGVNPMLAQQVAEDAGIQIVYVYTGSLSRSGEDADSYSKFMRYNVNAIVNALK